MRFFKAVTFAATALWMTANAGAAITLYEHEGFRGRAVTINSSIANLKQIAFNDAASSALVDSGQWLACEHDNFGGRCVVLRTGSYSSLAQLGMQDSITSIRPQRGGGPQYDRPDPQAAPNYDYYRRPNERVFEAPVVAVRAVVGSAERRCWIERQQVSGSGQPNVGGAILGAIIGGVLGHQVGSGRGNDAATAGGAIAGAAIGSGTGGGNLPYSRDVRRCDNVPGGEPTYWDVTYNFRGYDHHIQMSQPPGPTILVNGRGEPRQ